MNIAGASVLRTNQIFYNGRDVMWKRFQGSTRAGEIEASWGGVFERSYEL